MCPAFTTKEAAEEHAARYGGVDCEVVYVDGIYEVRGARPVPYDEDKPLNEQPD